MRIYFRICGVLSIILGSRAVAQYNFYLGLGAYFIVTGFLVASSSE